MTPRLLTKIKELVEAGATVVGARPLRSPSLADYPRCDWRITSLAEALWGNCDGKAVTEHHLGKGRVIQGQGRPKKCSSAWDAAGLRLPCQRRRHVLRYTHRAGDGVDVYFVANKVGSPEEAVCQFRVQGKRPELWWPETGRIERAAAYNLAGDCVRVPLQLDSFGSVFVLFRSAAEPGPRHLDHVQRPAGNDHGMEERPGSTRANADGTAGTFFRNSLGQAGDGHHIAR